MSHVIACIDGTEVTSAVCDYSVWASQKLSAPLEFLHVLDKSEYPTESNLSGNIGLGSRESLLDELAALDEKRGKLAMEQGRILLEAAKQRALDNQIENPQSIQRHGSLVETLVEMEENCRLLVMGKHDHNLNEHIGSRLENVVRTIHRPILITTQQYQTPSKIMIAFDASTTTRKGIEMIASSPLFKGLPCHIVMVGQDSESNHKQLNWAKQTLAEHGFEASTAIINGEIETVLCDYRAKNKIDLLIMGAYGHSVVRRFLVGSTTTNVIRNAAIPVLLLR